MNRLSLFQLFARFSILRRLMAFLLPMLLAAASLALLSNPVMPAPGQISADDPFTVSWISFEAEGDQVVAWGDYDGDGDLDLAVGVGCIASPSLFECYPSRLYRNDGLVEGELQLQLAWTSAEAAHTKSIAWGDYDRDGDLDLAMGLDGVGGHPELYTGIWLYRNDGGMLSASPVYSITSASGASSPQNLAWGDYDGDSDLDLAVAQDTSYNRLYRNDSAGGVITMTQVWSVDYMGYTYDIAWGDYDGDGDLDLATGGISSADWYRNDFGALTTIPVYTTPDANVVYSIAWGDVDGDGDPDMAAGNSGRPNRIYRNDGVVGGVPQVALAWSAAISEVNRSLAWGDYDGDGDLDLAVGNGCQFTPYVCYASHVYRNDSLGGVITMTLAWSLPDVAATTSLVWGDADGDGDLDLAVGNMSNPTQLYRNEGGNVGTRAGWSSTESCETTSVAWGDVDNDGDLDLATGCSGVTGFRSILLYDNSGDELGASAVYSSGDTISTSSIAWGDYDGDGILDLAAGSAWGPTRLYRNDGTTLTLYPVYSTTETSSVYSLAWGDVDSDGDLDLAVGNWGSPTRLYRNEGIMLTASATWASTETNYAHSIAWGDVDGDGDPDLMVGNGSIGGISYPDRLYRNDGGTLSATAVYSTAEVDDTRSVAWGDVDGDGDLDLAVGNQGRPNLLYRNDGGALSPNAVWRSAEGDSTTSIAWGDYDGDGDLDLAAGNGIHLETGCGDYCEVSEPNRLYRNDNGVLTSNAVWSSAEADNTTGIAWGDVDGDGDLDLAASNECKYLYDPCYPSRVYYNGRDGRLLPGSAPLVYVARPGPNADFFSSPAIWGSSIISMTYTLSDLQGDPVRFIRAWYSPDGGGKWHPAAAASGTITTDLKTAASVDRVYAWDVAQSGVMGRLDNVVFRMEAIPAFTHRRNSIPGPFLHAPYASHTFPFRVQGTQVRVFSETVAAGNEVAGAMIYRLKAGHSAGGELMVDASGRPFRTDSLGYLQGRGQLEPGDRLLAMLPITRTGSYTLYYTSGAPTPTGLDVHTVTPSGGVQTLTVSADNPLILFDLDVSLEWDAHNDPAYLEQLAFNLQRASEYLYDFSDGQVALGQVNVFQNADEWVYSHIVIQANNRLRPFAAQGGVVFTDTVDPQHNTPTDTIRYGPGQVSMGSTWNRYGNPGQSLGDDWSIILAHELGHYLLYHDDTYLGLDPDGFLVPVSTCLGSAMSDLYSNPANTEFIADEGVWQAGCADTLAEQTLGRNEWETMQLWYPWLVAPMAVNFGPPVMPFGLTTVEIHDPYTPTDTLVDPTFYLDYVGGGGSSSEARAYLLREEYVVNLGSPFGGQNRVIARGAKPGDRLCVFDRPRAQFGCEEIELGDDRLSMRRDTGWNPIVQLRPVNSTTLNISVTNAVSIIPPLRARLFPDLGYARDPITLTLSGGVYLGTFTTTYPVMSGNIQVWVDETATEANPRRETIVAYSIGGNPGSIRGSGGSIRGSGGSIRGSGGSIRGSGGSIRGSGAPVVSPDGQMIFFSEASIVTGTFFAVQAMAGLPPLPPGRTLVGQGYNLVASPGATLPIASSVSIQYLSNDVLVAGASEDDLTLYFWDGGEWEALDTVLDTYFNLATAPSQGEGVYALLASAKIPLYGPGWNNFAYSIHETQPVTQALLSISGYYTTVYGYVATDTVDPWRVYDVTVPDYVNDLDALKYGHGYWINVSRNITLHLGSPETGFLGKTRFLGTMPLPPATFYGVIDDGLTPGMQVTAWINGRLCGQAQTMEFEGQVVYAINVLAEDAARAAGCGTPGREVTFRVGEYVMAPAVAWDNNRVREVTLSPILRPWRVYLPMIIKQDR